MVSDVLMVKGLSRAERAALQEEVAARLARKNTSNPSGRGRSLQRDFESSRFPPSQQEYLDQRYADNYTPQHRPDYPERDAYPRHSGYQVLHVQCLLECIFSLFLSMTVSVDRIATQSTTATVKTSSGRRATMATAAPSEGNRIAESQIATQLQSMTSGKDCFFRRQDSFYMFLFSLLDILQWYLSRHSRERVTRSDIHSRVPSGSVRNARCALTRARRRHRAASLLSSASSSYFSMKQRGTSSTTTLPLLAVGTMVSCGSKLQIALTSAAIFCL